MAATDAQFYWMSAKLPSDQFLLYAFAGVPDDVAAGTAAVLDRARRVPDLAMRVADGLPPAAGSRAAELITTTLLFVSAALSWITLVNVGFQHQDAGQNQQGFLLDFLSHFSSPSTSKAPAGSVSSGRR